MTMGVLLENQQGKTEQCHVPNLHAHPMATIEPCKNSSHYVHRDGTQD